MTGKPSIAQCVAMLLQHGQHRLVLPTGAAASGPTLIGLAGGESF